MTEEMITGLLTGDNAVMGIAIVIMWKQVKEVVKLLKSNNEKLDNIDKAIVTMDLNVQEHTVILEFGAKEMARIDEHNKAQDSKIEKNRDDINKIKGRMTND